jgi:pyrimidine-nucleoside phosphorylase
MSKKLAVTSDLILLDVKAGSGAFMKTVEHAGELARACLALAEGADRVAKVAVTDMAQPLGDAVGNALDIVETVALLRGEHRGRLRELAALLVARGLETLHSMDPAGARDRAERALDSGEALERFRRMVQAQGGEPRVVDDPVSVLPKAPVVQPLVADRSGVVSAIDAEAIGSASGALGAGRIRKGDPIDPAVGIVVRAKLGNTIEKGQLIGQVHARDLDAATAAASHTLAALTLSDDAVVVPPLVHEWLG